MEDYTKILEQLENEHKTLQFDFFSAETAWKIGVLLREKAITEKKNITVHIVRNSQVLFHCALDGTRPDNDGWLDRKTKTVCRFNRSSLYMGKFLKNLGLSLEEKYHVSENEYCIQGGGFPVFLKNTGVIGAIIVSGMTDEEDHQWVVWAIKTYLDGL